jgi:hypothetical protein
VLRALVGGALSGVLAHLVGRRRSGRPAAPDDAQLSLDLPGHGAPRRSERPHEPVAKHPDPPPRPAAPPATADALLARLYTLGLGADLSAGGIDRCRLTRNRAVMVSFRNGELRIHRGYLAAPDEVLRAVVALVQARTRARRAAAQRVILAFPVHAGDAAAPAPRPRGRERTHAADEPMVRVLAEWHRRYNDRYFGGRLSAVPIRVSRRLRRRLGHYTAAASGGLSAEIVIGRSHIRRHGWEEALHTLLHEMVHQWQDETGQAIDHGAGFRRKAREVGITPAARRVVGRRGESAA